MSAPLAPPTPTPPPTFRETLRSLPSLIGRPPPASPDAKTIAPHQNPLEHFRTWLTEAITHQIPEPHAVTLSTADALGPDSRVLILKDVTDEYIEIACSGESLKSRQMGGARRVGVGWYVKEFSRGVRIRGNARLAARDVCEADWKARAVGARAVVIAAKHAKRAGHCPVDRKEIESCVEEVGREMRVLGGSRDGKEGKEGEGEPVSAEEAGWQVWRIFPESVEFWQGREDMVHDRLKYSRGEGEGEDVEWKTETLWP